MKRLMVSMILLFTACATQTKLPAPVRAAISARHMGTVVELKVSCYYGDLYDENEKWLLSPYPFAQTYHIVDLDGAPIHPRGERGIIPAGTPFIVRDVEFPDPGALAKRMLTTPRYNPWVYLTPAPDAKNLPEGRAFFILLLPMDLDDEPTTERAYNGLLAPKGDMTTWLAGRRPTVQAGIAHKEIVEGMTEAELVVAMGPVLRRFNDTLDGKAVHVAWFGAKEAWLSDGLVVASKLGRPEPKETQPLSGAAIDSSAPTNPL